MAIKQIESQRYRWLNLVRPTLDDVKEIRQQVANLDSRDLEAILARGKRPIIEARATYVSIILIFPYLDRERGEIVSTELDILFNDKWIITAHGGKLPALKEVFQTSEGRAEARDEIFDESPTYLIETLLNRLINYTYLLLDRLSDDIDSQKKELFVESPKSLLGDILSIRRNITELRRIMQTHKTVLRKLTAIIKSNGYAKNETDKNKQVMAFNDIIERVKDVWEQLEGYRESIEALHETNESLISNRLNDIMRSFTTISVLIFSMTLVATIFGLDAGGTPIVASRFGFWIIISLLLLTAILMLQYFKKKQWLK